MAPKPANDNTRPLSAMLFLAAGCALLMLVFTALDYAVFHGLNALFGAAP